ncbi:DUF5320 domain-containing protein [Desulfosediminicola sp.]|uniref:DUF5320 domain-containing protein n=1 Tax=Desulfosediminicola sp. TaxID=2886825 RepID=UPI003AF251B8
MPGFDKSGPQGMGPATGGGRGKCRRDVDGQAVETGRMSGRGGRSGGAGRQGRGRGMWCAMGEMANAFMGRGTGRGFGRRFMVNQPPEQAERDIAGEQPEQNYQKGKE